MAVITESSIIVHPLQPTIGAEISGVDLRQPLSDSQRDQIKRAILEYKVVFFRDQDLDRDQHASFARQFGPLYTHPSTTKSYAGKVPAIHDIKAPDEAKYAKYLAKQKSEGWDAYHSDTSWRLVPTWGAVLRAVNLPDVGGDTIWVDAGLAYDGLPEEVKGRLDGLHVTHDYRDALVSAGHDYPIVACHTIPHPTCY
jgi:taurine dioxygenase